MILRPAIDHYVHTQKATSDSKLAADQLSYEDWEALEEIKTILEPLAEATFKLEYRGVHGNTGSLWQWLEKIDKILDIMESKKEALQANMHTNKHVITLVELIWAKIDYYYRRSDETPAYRAAIILHPGKKLYWLEKRWTARAEWILEARESFKELVREYAVEMKLNTMRSPKKRQPERSSPRKRKPRTDFRCETSDSDWEPEDPIENELTRYLNSAPISRQKHNGEKISINVLEWWLARRGEYPILSSIALDLAAVQPESSDLERKFSDALNSFTDKRNCLNEETIEALEVTKSAYREGIKG